MATKSMLKQMKERAVSEEVSEILAMSEAVNRSLTKIEDKTGIIEVRLEFDGFDANNEDDHWNAYVRHCSITRQDPMNSHGRRLRGYQGLGQRWRQSADKQNLTKADLVRMTADE